MSNKFKSMDHQPNDETDLIVLAGGKGTRIREITRGSPKCLLPVGDSFIIDIVLEKLVDFNLRNIYFSVCHRINEFQEYLKARTSRSAKRVNLIEEPIPLGTGGAIRFVIDSVPTLSDPFFVLNGDTLVDVNLDEMKTTFNKAQKDLMLAVIYVEDVSRYGKIQNNGDELTGLLEKGANGPGWINIGRYLFQKAPFDNFSGNFSLELDLLPQFIKTRDVIIYQSDSKSFVDIGIPEDYFNYLKQAQRSLSHGLEDRF